MSRPKNRKMRKSEREKATTATSTDELPISHPSVETGGRGLISLLLSPELRLPYLTLLGLSAVAGYGLFGWGAYSLYREWQFGFKDVGAAISYLVQGSVLLLVAVSLPQVRRYFSRIQELTVAQIKSVELGKINEQDFEKLDQANQLREEKARHDFQRNVGSTLVVEQLEARDILLFPQATWNLQPGVNVLLGRNGYGKSLILRSLAGVLQHDEQVMNTICRSSNTSAQPCIEVRLKRNGKAVRIQRNERRFVESIGKVPLLAIPDSRFMDRSQEMVGPTDNETADLLVHGAHHFLGQKPYESVVRALLYEICLDYWEHNKSFDLPVFKFLSECVRRLTDYDFRFKSIERKGRTGFEIRVLTEGNEDSMPIQYASQGTLSVLAMCGLIRSYVQTVSPQSTNALVHQGSAIVLIDEADAHLHPAWQQKLCPLLKDLFPNVQFILSAHSPLLVAGCWHGEVAVLRRQMHKRGSRFTVEQLDQDFIGATAAELYQKVFEIEELDATYLEYATKATQLTSSNERIQELNERQELGNRWTKEDEAELRHLEEERRRVRAAVEVQERRREDDDKDLKIEELNSRILALETRLATSAQETNK